jgi:hypothetical protein
VGEEVRGKARTNGREIGRGIESVQKKKKGKRSTRKERVQDKTRAGKAESEQKR